MITQGPCSRPHPPSPACHGFPGYRRKDFADPLALGQPDWQPIGDSNGFSRRLRISPVQLVPRYFR